MKKLIAILVVFALVAGSAFAQWSFGGKVDFPMHIDFTPTDPVFDGTKYGDDGLGAEVSATYNSDAGLSVGLARDFDGYLKFSASYSGDGYSFAYAGNLLEGANIDTRINTLWASFSLLDGQIDLDIAYRGKYHYAWTIGGDWDGGLFINDYGWSTEDWSYPHWDNLDGRGGIRLNFKPRAVSGLSVGFLIPMGHPLGTWQPNPQYGDNYFAGLGGGFTGNVDFVNHFLKQTLFGVKFTGVDNLTIATMFRMRGRPSANDTYGLWSNMYNDWVSAGTGQAIDEGDKWQDYQDIYVGAAYANIIDGLNVGFAAMLFLGNYYYFDGATLKTALPIAVGLDVSFSAGDLSIGLPIKFYTNPSGDMWGSTYIGEAFVAKDGMITFGPSISYSLDPFGFGIDTCFGLSFATNAGLDYEVTPGIYWKNGGAEIQFMYVIGGNSEQSSLGTNELRLRFIVSM